MLLDTLKKEYGWLKFVASDNFVWSPAHMTIYYDKEVDERHLNWSLLHELSHALLDHQDFETDFDLLKLEADAWSEAKQQAKKYEIKIDENHIQDSLDTYRDWLHRRSKCPECQMVNPQHQAHKYTCFNCGQSWTVSDSQLCSIQTKQA